MNYTHILYYDSVTSIQETNDKMPRSSENLTFFNVTFKEMTETIYDMNLTGFHLQQTRRHIFDSRVFFATKNSYMHNVAQMTILED